MTREARTDRSETREPEGRQKRIPLGTPMPRLHAETRTGFVRRWINDDKGRLQRAEQAGYTGVQTGDGQTEKRLVGTNEQGQPMYAHLMEQRQEYYDEDQAAKRAENAKVDEAIKAGRNNPATSLSGADQGQFYGSGQISRS